MPAGSTVETYNGSTRISWSKRGGYAGENSIIRTKEKAMADSIAAAQADSISNAASMAADSAATDSSAADSIVHK